MLFRLAVRNVARNPRRSAITALSVAIGLAALIFIWGFVDGMNCQMIENTTRLFSGDVQVHRKGYHDDPSLDRALTRMPAMLQAVRSTPGVAAATVRLEGRALASRGEKSRGVVISGLDLDTEPGVTDLFTTLIDGAVPTATDAHGVLIGAQLAEALSLATGGEIVLIGQAEDGSVASGRFPVRGVFRTQIDEIDSFVVVMPLSAAGEFFSAFGDATAIILRLADRDQLDTVRAGLQARLGGRYEVLGWPQLQPVVAVSARFHDVTGWVVLGIFFVLVAASVVNPVLMGVLERTREFGVMLAVGMSRGRLLRLVLYETALLAALGLLVGDVAGVALTAYFGEVGIDLGAFGAGMRTMPGLADLVYTELNAQRVVTISVLVFVLTSGTALYPAFKAATLEPVRALRGNLREHALRSRARATRHWPVFALIAARSVLRNPRRTAITVGGTAFAIVAFVFLFGVFDGFGEQIIDNSTRYLTGHMQIERQGFRRDFSADLSIEGGEQLLARLQEAPNVAAVAPRIQAQALASSARRSEGVLLIGIDPGRERQVTFIDRTIIEGQSLVAGADREIMIGRELAAKLGLRLGEKMVVAAQAAGGDLSMAAYRIGAIYATESSVFDSTMAFVTLPAAQALLGQAGRISTVNVRLLDRTTLEATARDLKRRLGDTGLTLVAWPTLLPQVDQMVRLTRVLEDIVLAIALLVVAMAIMNTVFMAVSERTREFGILMALGTRPSAVLRMVVYETLVLMLLASAIGHGVGIALVRFTGARGLDLSALFGGLSTIPGLTGVIRPYLDPYHVVVPGLALIVIGVLASLYPAVRAARLDPVRAIRHA